MVFSRFLSMTIFIPAENTRHSEKLGQNPANCQQIIFITQPFLGNSSIFSAHKTVLEHFIHLMLFHLFNG
jgi:hypothetical protein